MSPTCSYRDERVADDVSLDGSLDFGSSCGGRWTFIESTSPDVPPVCTTSYSCLFRSERVELECPEVCLLNAACVGTLLLTTCRIVFLRAGELQPLALGTMYIPAIESALSTNSALFIGGGKAVVQVLQIKGKDARSISLAFGAKESQRQGLFLDTLLRLIPLTAHDLPTFVLPDPANSTRCSKVQGNRSTECMHDAAMPGCRDSMLVQDPDAATCQPRDISQGCSSRRCESCGTCGVSRVGQDMPPHQSVLVGEYARMLSALPPHLAAHWRISAANSSHRLCPSYPARLLLPRSITDGEALESAAFRGRSRFPAVCWQSPDTGAVLARSAQPLTGLMCSSRSDADESLMAQLASQSRTRRLIFADARPRKNALANGALGGGCESPANYPGTEVVFLGIDNIHCVRESMQRLREALADQGNSTSAPFSRLAEDSASAAASCLGLGFSALPSSSTSASSPTATCTSVPPPPSSLFSSSASWLHHLHSLISSASFIASQIALHGVSVLVHCSDGWDRTSSLVATALLLLDPHYRNFDGFQSLVEVQWLAFGHRFAERMGHPPLTSPGSTHATPPMQSGDTSSGSGCAPTLQPSQPGFLSSSYFSGSSNGRMSASSSFGHLHASSNLIPEEYERASSAYPTASILSASFHHGPQQPPAVPPALATQLSSSTFAPSPPVAHRRPPSVPHASALSASATPCSGSFPPSAGPATTPTGLTGSASSYPSCWPTTANQSPIFMQWLDCVAQLVRMYPQDFEFTEAFLVDLSDAALSGRFANFLGNSEMERVRSGLLPHAAASPTGSPQQLPCVWAHLRHQRKQSHLPLHQHCNILFRGRAIRESGPPAASPPAVSGDSSACASSSAVSTSACIADPCQAPTNGPLLLPPAASLLPALQPHLFMRWCCPVSPSGSPLLPGLPQWWGPTGCADAEARAQSLRAANAQQNAAAALDHAREAEDELLQAQQLLQQQQQSRQVAEDAVTRMQKEADTLRQLLQTFGCQCTVLPSGELQVLLEDASEGQDISGSGQESHHYTRGLPEALHDSRDSALAALGSTRTTRGCESVGKAKAGNAALQSCGGSVQRYVKKGSLKEWKAAWALANKVASSVSGASSSSSSSSSSSRRDPMPTVEPFAARPVTRCSAFLGYTVDLAALERPLIADYLGTQTRSGSPLKS